MPEFASFWYGGQLDPYGQLCVRSFLDHGHDFTLYAYGRTIDVPKGCIIRDAAEIYPEDQVFFYQGGPGGKVSAFSNMFRYKMIAETGKCWVDTDVVCLSDEVPETPYLFARQDDEFFNGAVLRFPIGHEAMSLAAEYCWEARLSAKWGDLGPRLMTRIIDEYDLSGEATPTRIIYPLHWREAGKLFDPEARDDVAERVDEAALLHLWNEIIGRLGIDKNSPPPSGSYLADIFDRYGIS